MERELKDKESLSLGNKLKEIREILGMSRNVFAREAKIDVTHYTKIEEGVVLPDYLFLKHLMHTYRISPYFLFDLQEESMEKDKMEGRRNYVRFSTHLKAQYFLKERKGDWEECTIINVSLKGMKIEFKTHEKINIATTVHLKVNVPIESEPFSLKGVLKWIKQGENYCIGGIELTEILDEINLIKMLRGQIL